MTDQQNRNKENAEETTLLSSASFNFDELKKLGMYPHLEGTEIEMKLDILDGERPLSEVMETLQQVLESHGCAFMGPLEIRHNYTLFYTEPKAARGKIIIRNGGAGGYQVKFKSPREKERDLIVIKKEEKSDNFATLGEARQYLAEQIGISVEELERYFESAIQINKHKLTLFAKGADSVTRVFRLVADESVLAEQVAVPAKHLKQVELEYKGSDRQEEDSVEQIERQMTEMISALVADSHIALQPTTQSKRNWARR